MHHDIGHRIEPARGQIFGAGDEVPGRIVDEVGQRAVPEDRLDHFVDRERIADVDAMACDPTAIGVHQFGRGFITHAFTTAANVDLGTELEETRGHRLAESGAAAGDKNAPAGKKFFVEHGSFHPKGLPLNWSID